MLVEGIGFGARTIALVTPRVLHFLSDHTRKTRHPEQAGGMLVPGVNFGVYGGI